MGDPDAQTAGEKKGIVARAAKQVKSGIAAAAQNLGEFASANASVDEK